MIVIILGETRPQINGFRSQFSGRAVRARVSTSTRAAPASQQHTGAFRRGGAGGEHVVDQQDAQARDRAARLHGEGAGDVALALRIGCCRPCDGVRAAAQQPVGAHLDPAQLADRMGQHRRLVVAAREEPRPMQRHRHDHIGFGEQRGPGAAHELAQRRRELQPVAMLEGQHQRPAFLVVAQGRARPGEGRLVARAQGAERPSPRSRSKGRPQQAQQGAPRNRSCASTAAHSAPWSLTGSLHRRQRGGSSRSSSAPPRRRRSSADTGSGMGL